MAKQRKSFASIASISEEQAHQALTFLIGQGKVGIKTVEKALKNRQKLIGEVRDRLEALGVDAGNVVGRLAKDGLFPMLEAVRKKAGPRSRKTVSAAVKKTRQAQGRYLGAIRQLSKANRKKIKAIREKSGVNAAIAMAKKMVR